MSQMEKDPILLIRQAMAFAGCDKSTVDNTVDYLPDFFRQPLMPTTDENGLLDLVRDMRTAQKEFSRIGSDARLVQKTSHERGVDKALTKIAEQQQGLF